MLALCELEDRSYAEIGELVGLNENAVAQLVFRARERLRTELRLVQVDPESLPEECRAYLPLLAQHLDGKLKGPRLDETLGHLESCERCQAALADMREAKRRYRALYLPPLGVPAEEARAAIEDELERAGYWRGGAARRSVLRRPRGRAGAVAIAAVAALCVGGGLGAATLLGERSEPTTVAADDDRNDGFEDRRPRDHCVPARKAGRGRKGEADPEGEAETVAEVDAGCTKPAESTSEPTPTSPPTTPVEPPPSTPEPDRRPLRRRRPLPR